ncbi:MAG: hypothetical protein OEY59_13570 [Deltaproteobacteria bacterium]|nr:hypothetical protein [Deltaproteobacteria bacterium]
MNWNEGVDPTLLAKKLEELKVLKNGKVTFEAFASQEYMTVLSGMISLADGIPSELKRGIINTSIFSAAKKGVINQNSISKEIKIQESAYFKKPLSSHVLVSSLSISSFEELPPIRINDCSITFPASLPNKYRIARQEIDRRASQWIYRKKPINYINIIARVKSRSVEESANLALDQIDFIRGIWNLLHTNSMRISSGRIKPVNSILLGPVHTIHLPSKELATDTYWYQPNYHDDISAFRFSGNKEKTLTFTAKIRKQLRGHPYREFVEEGIRRYARALDYSDLDAAFLKLWAVLEMLTNTLKSTYNITVKRAVFVFDDTVFHQQVLNNLRSYRNSSVHSGKESNKQTESYLYQLKRYVEQLLSFHIWVGVRFSNFTEATSFLDLKPNASELSAQRKIIDLAIKYRKK